MIAATAGGSHGAFSDDAADDAAGDISAAVTNALASVAVMLLRFTNINRGFIRS